MLTYALEKRFHLSEQVNSVAFSPNGRHLAVTLDSRVLVWDTITWLLDLRFRNDDSNILSVAWDSSNRLLFGCDKGLLTIVSFDDDKFLHCEGFHASEKPIQFIAINSRADVLALGGEDEVTIWRLEQGHSKSEWVFFRQLDDPLAERDTATVNVTGIAWADECLTCLIVSYDKQGVVTWDIQKGILLSKTGKITQTHSPTSSRIDAPRPLIGGGPHFAVSSGKEVRVFDRKNGKDIRCLTSPGLIPSGSPMIWAHDESCIIVALEDAITLLQIETQRETMLNIEDCTRITHLAWIKAPIQKGHTPASIYRIATVSGSCALRILRADDDDSAPPKRIGYFRIAIFVLLVTFVLAFLRTSPLIL